MEGKSIQNHYGLRGKWLYSSLMICTSFAMLLFGYDQGVFGGILTIDGFERRFKINHNETLKGIIVGTYDLGCLFGALATIWIGERIGRKKSILLGTVVMIIGALLQTLANEVMVMVAGRIVSGLGNGMNTATAPVWAAEASKTANRGKSGIALMVINIGGLAVSCWMTYFFSFITSELAWRFPLGFQMFFGVVILAFAFWLPESPRWLMSKHREREAKAIMAALEGGDATTTSTSIIQEFNMIKISIAAEQSTVVKRKTMPRWRLLLGVGAQAMQQLTGINIICYYLPYVLVESVGQDASTARVVAAVNALSYLGATLVGLRFIDRWGRRRLMYIGAIGQCLCWLTITVLLAYADKAVAAHAGSPHNTEKPSDQSSNKTKVLGSVSVAFFFLFNVFFGAGWQGVSWLYPTEINSTQNRILGMSLGVATNWAINFAVVFVTPLGIAKLRSQFYIIWTICNLLIVPTIYLFYPETSGRSLEAIDTLFENNNTIWAAFNPDMHKMKPIDRVSSNNGNDTETGTADIQMHDTPADDSTGTTLKSEGDNSKDASKRTSAAAPPTGNPATGLTRPTQESEHEGMYTTQDLADAVLAPRSADPPNAPSAASERFRARTNTHESTYRGDFRLQPYATAGTIPELGRETSTTLLL